MIDPKYIIVQASGRGSRMGHLTNNRPKALISVDGQPLLLRLMKLYPDSHFIIIGYYKFNILQKYITQYSPTSNVTIIKSDGDNIGNNSGIREALSHVGDKTSLMILWSDLLHQKKIDFSNLKNNHNHIGLSGTFPCRWSFRNKQLVEKKSKVYGIAGVYIFKNKDQIKDVPSKGEFCEYLQRSNLNLQPFSLSGYISEVGTLKKYKRIINSSPVGRPFNKIVVTKDTVSKIPRDKQGETLSKIESSWYQEFESQNWQFLPKIISHNPIVMEKISGLPLYYFNKFSLVEKQKHLEQIVNNLRIIHHSKKSKKNNYHQNNFDAYLKKAKDRVDEVSDLIPFIDQESININGRKYKNPYRDWSHIEKITTSIFTDTYTPIHGDLTFSNTLYDDRANRIFFIDPRGYFGQEKIYGDPDYDWAKLYQSLVGNYDQFNRKSFKLDITKDNVHLDIDSNGYTRLKSLFFKLTNSDPYKINLLHGLNWLSLSSYCWDDYDSICGAFYNGVRILNDLD
jgi:choline kinase